MERIGAHWSASERIWSVLERIGAYWSISERTWSALVYIKIITIIFFEIIWMHNH